MATSAKSNTREVTKEWEVFKVLDDSQALETSGEVDARHARSISLYVATNSPAVSGGTIKLEASPEENYTGTWLEIGSITVGPGGPNLEAVTVDETENGMPCRVVRARISGIIANGTIDAFIITQH